MSRLGDHLHAVRWELAIVGAAITTIGIRDWDWGANDGFQTIEEGWFAKNTRHGGMDKIGHSFLTYVIADLLTDRIRANASDPAGAPVTASLVAFYGRLERVPEAQRALADYLQAHPGHPLDGETKRPLLLALKAKWMRDLRSVGWAG